MVGVAILAFFALVAITAPLLFPRSNAPEVTQATGGSLSKAALFVSYPLGTDDTWAAASSRLLPGACVSP